MSARNRRPAVLGMLLALALSGAITISAPGRAAAQAPVPAETGAVPATPPATTGAATTAPAPTGGATPPTTSTDDALTVARTYQIPDPPAMVLIGSTATLDRPGTPAEVGAALINLVTPDGKVRSGAAIEISLRALGLEQAHTHYEYVSHWWSRFAERTALSVATVVDSATGAEAGVTRLAVGLRLVLFDEADPLLQTRYRQRVAYANAQCPNTNGSIEQRQCMVDVNNGMTQEQLDKFAKPRWNASALAVATAVDWAFDQGELKSHQKDVFAAWLAGAYGVSTWLQLTAAGQYRRLWATDSNLYAFAVRLRTGNEKARFTAEGGYSIVRPDDPTLRRGRAAVGGELLVSDGTWLSVTFGGDFAGTDSASSVFVLSNLKFAFVNKPDW